MYINKVKLETYNKNWPSHFAQEKQKLEAVFADLEIAFFHIGSTSIPGCPAKPIIDILGVVADITQLDAYNTAMSQLGYEALGEYGMRRRRFFRRKFQEPVNLHIFEDTDPNVERHLRFCDYLRTHQGKMIEYAKVKKALAERFPADMDQYTIGKESFIKNIDYLAAKEANQLLFPMRPWKRKKEWSEQELLLAMTANMGVYLTYFAKYSPLQKWIFEPDVTVVQSEFDDPAFNYIFDARFEKEERIAATCLQKRPYYWITAENDLPKNIGALLQEHGLQLSDDPVGMVKILASTVPRHSHLRFEHVATVEDVPMGDENIAAYRALYRSVPPILYCEGTPYEFHVGYLEGKPVVRAVLILHAGLAGIYHLATCSTHRKRGYATAMMHYLLDGACAKGFHRAVLMASRDLSDFYKKMGFEHLCQYEIYSKRE